MGGVCLCGNTAGYSSVTLQTYVLYVVQWLISSCHHIDIRAHHILGSGPDLCTGHMLAGDDGGSGEGDEETALSEGH